MYCANRDSFDIEYDRAYVCKSLSLSSGWNYVSSVPPFKKKVEVLYSNSYRKRMLGIFKNMDSSNWTESFMDDKLMKWNTGSVPVAWRVPVSKREEKFSEWRNRTV